MKKETKAPKVIIRKLLHMAWSVASVIIVASAVYFVIKNNEASNALQTYVEQQPTPQVLTPRVITPGALVQDVVTTNPKPAKKGALTLAGVIEKTNLERTNLAIIALSHSRKLDASAQKKAEDILARQYFEHTSPDGKTVADLVTEQQYNYIKIGENLALGTFANDADVVAAWMKSQGHKENILDSDYTEMGVGVAYGTYQGHTVAVIVQHFGRPVSLCPILDASMKIQVEAVKSELDTMAKNLEFQKKTISEGIEARQNMTDAVDAYNKAVDAYEIKATMFEQIRVLYNTEVEDFNRCVSALH